MMLINNGGIAEQVVGQLLRTTDAFYMEPALFYWKRSKLPIIIYPILFDRTDITIIG